jgi:cytochrome c
MIKSGAAMGSFFFETGKTAGGLLGALALAMSLMVISDRIFGHRKLVKAGYIVSIANDGQGATAVARTEQSAGGGAQAQLSLESGASAVKETRSAEVDSAAIGASGRADAGALAPTRAASFDDPSMAGEKKAHVNSKACEACDTSEKGVAAKAGPPLFAIVDRPKSAVAGLAHSNSLRAQEANWTVDDLNQFFASPHGFASGAATGGEADAAKRADIVEYLRALSDHSRLKAR